MSTVQKPLPAQDEEALLSSIESILLVAGGPVALTDLASALCIPHDRLGGLLGTAATRLAGGIRLQLNDGQAQLVTAPENVETVQRFLGAARPAPLTRAGLETLAIVAYRQPITRPEIEALRGVNSDRAVQTLVARGLIEERGQRQVPGRPTEYGTTFGFLEYFGLGSLADLPPLPETGEETIAPANIGLRAAGGGSEDRPSAGSRGGSHAAEGAG